MGKAANVLKLLTCLDSRTIGVKPGKATGRYKERPWNQDLQGVFSVVATSAITRQWCRENLHKPVRMQWKTLCAKVRAHYACYGITGNNRALGSFVDLVKRSWKHWLNRRNNECNMTWEKFNLLLKCYPLPLPKIVHSVFRKKTTWIRLAQQQEQSNSLRSRVR